MYPKHAHTVEERANGQDVYNWCTDWMCTHGGTCMIAQMMACSRSCAHLLHEFLEIRTNTNNWEFMHSSGCAKSNILCHHVRG